LLLNGQYGINPRSDCFISLQGVVYFPDDDVPFVGHGMLFFTATLPAFFSSAITAHNYGV
jgi:hypothetical protein